jgi:hypothetical protein
LAFYTKRMLLPGTKIRLRNIKKEKKGQCL